MRGHAPFKSGEDNEIALPFWLSACARGIVAARHGRSSTIGVHRSHEREGLSYDEKAGTQPRARSCGPSRRAPCSPGVLFLGLAAACCFILLKDMPDRASYICVLIGLACGMIIGKFTEYFTSFDFRPRRTSIKDRGKTGPATVVIQGLGVGMISCRAPIVVVSSCAISRATPSAASTASPSRPSACSPPSASPSPRTPTAPSPTTPAASPRWTEASEEVRDITDALDALGNTTAATGKGFAIGSAVLTSLSLFAAFKEQIGSSTCRCRRRPTRRPRGMLFGAMLPYIFAALTMISVGKAAAEIIIRGARPVPQPLKTAARRTTAKTTLKDCIPRGPWRRRRSPSRPHMDVIPTRTVRRDLDHSRRCKEMIARARTRILAPLFVGFLVGPRFLVGMLAGAVGLGRMLAIMMANAGGAWDNSKKPLREGRHVGLSKVKNAEGAAQHPMKKTWYDACVVGDTVGDPFKDTSGPALNILIKLMSMVSLTIAPLLKTYDKHWEFYYWGFPPLGSSSSSRRLVVYTGILTWEDPIGKMLDEGEKKSPAEASVVSNKRGRARRLGTS